eukprot:CAMPEP_0113418508 /NCGR_PEP_ID=MMETSP0013_2-20120614/26249_1 /TAXON_ID=2843 ORGANISM="Skeletonema costatum, Strain 1716" /NCGR_SAMPLE_ID=MMETSP0013_2 /ASSEMBLY_ACC=CAM_ASM_000158 /LENGTH=644 /DNA_ID=CAMNT_0000305759 /DNA_START=106 /DNA_END=2040 /DNA_ORIENTATION=+ /assembly_acc=CAM_ASM_000158
MILKFSLYSAAGVALLSSTVTDAFAPSKRTTRAFQLRSSPDGENGPSPELLKKMGLAEDTDVNELRQQTAAAGPPPGMSPLGPAGQMQQPPPPQAAVPPPPPPQQQFFDANGNPVSVPMVYDTNGNLVQYTPPPAQQQPMQQQPVQTTPSLEPVPWEPPLPPNPKRGDDPRPQGYNADSYAVSNTADVYFAQLKQDSRVRKRAWLSGDKETANQVFTDQTVKEIREGWVDNPYTKEKNIQEARAEIEGAVRMQLGGDGDSTTSKFTSGVSYKQKLEQMKAKRGKGGGAVQQSPPEPEQVVSKPPPPVQVTPPAPKVEEPIAPKMQEPPAAPVVPVVQPPVPKQQPPAPVQPKVITPPAMTTPTRSEEATEQALPGALSEDEKRRELRTLQGLLLKQRGGPGFGAGRLHEAEAQRLEKSLETVMGILRSEDGDFIAGTPSTGAAAAATPPPVAQAPKPVQPAQPVKPPVPAQPAQPVQPIQSAPAPAVQSQIDPMTGSIACVEAALKMYQDASPAERQVMMIPLREALMAAASGANKVISETELKAHKAAMEAGPPETAPTIQQAAPMMGFPTTYAVTKSDDAAEAVAAPADTDNMTKLNNAYDALTNAQGSGKLGLKNLSGSEAGALVSQVEALRGVLLDELNN